MFRISHLAVSLVLSSSRHEKGTKDDALACRGLKGERENRAAEQGGPVCLGTALGPDTTFISSPKFCGG